MTASSRDAMYGRRGGGWVTKGFTPGAGVEDVAKIRRDHLAKAKRDPKAKPWPDLEQLARLHEPTTDDGWEGRARMAAARQAVGHPLDQIDLQALDRTEDRAS